jgi:hypothetical protein
MKPIMISDEAHKMLTELKGRLYNGVQMPTLKNVLETAVRKFYNEIKESEAEKCLNQKSIL